MYAVNQCFDPRNLVSPRYKTLKVSVLSSENSVLCSDPERIGNILKNHFANIGDKLASEIPNAVNTILIPWTLRSILTYPDKKVVRRGVPQGSVLGPSYSFSISITNSPFICLPMIQP